MTRQIKDLGVVRVKFRISIVLILFLLIRTNLIAATPNCSEDYDLTVIEYQSQYKEAEMSRWFLAEHDDVDKAVLMVHGLNQKPSKLQALIDMLNKEGIPVFRLTLQGHGGAPFENMKQVTPEGWRANFQAGVCALQRRYPAAEKLLVAFLLGGLISQEFQVKTGHSLFSKQILLAPALALKPYVSFVKPITYVTSQVPSRAPEAYRANPNGTASSAYKSMFALIKSLQSRSDYQMINMQTLVMMDSNDEVVSYDAIEEAIKIVKLDRWKLLEVKKDGNSLKMDYHHLIIDQVSLGENGWKFLKSVMLDFINGKTISVYNSH